MSSDDLKKSFHDMTRQEQLEYVNGVGMFTVAGTDGAIRVFRSEVKPDDVLTPAEVHDMLDVLAEFLEQEIAIQPQMARIQAKQEETLASIAELKSIALRLMGQPDTESKSV